VALVRVHHFADQTTALAAPKCVVNRFAFYLVV